MRWMGKYNILFGLDTAFEFVHTTLGVIFQDLNSLDDSEIIRHYAISFLIVSLFLPSLFLTALPIMS